MRRLRIVMITMLLTLVLAGLIWLGQWPQRSGSKAVGASASAKPVVRLGLIPERDIYAQRRAFQALEGYLEKKTGCEFTLVTNSSYQGVLDDFREQRVDAAFLGSLVAVLTIDRLGADVLLKPEYEGGISTYCGVVFVKGDSPAKSFADLRGKTLAAVRTTTGGALTPVMLMVEHQMAGAPDAVKIKWVGTHDDVIREVMEGNVDAGATKDLRLNAWEARHPQFDVRELARSPRVPENALVVRKDLPDQVREKLQDALLGMHQEPEGRAVLKTMGLARFMACGLEDYNDLFSIIEKVGPAWPEVGVEGPAPRRPARKRSGPAVIPDVWSEHRAEE